MRRDRDDAGSNLFYDLEANEKPGGRPPGCAVEARCTAVGLPARGGACEHLFVTSQGWAYMRFRRALDRGNVTEALSAAGELQFVGLAEALELTLLLAHADQEKYERAAAFYP
jgi:hypothetical protein